jgi:phage regulator Rha-like protein
MNALISTQTPATMSSREIAELVESRHDNVKRTVETLAHKGVITFPQTEETSFKGADGRGQTVAVYNLDKRSSLIVVAQLSPEFTARIVDRWQELEATTRVPQDFESALRLAADQQREIKRLQLQAEVDAPKIEFAEAVSARAEEKSLMATAKHFGLPPLEFNQWLKRKGLIFKRQQYGGQHEFWEPKAHMSSGGYITLRQEMCKDGVTRPQAKVSGKGLEYIHKLLKQTGFP